MGTNFDGMTHEVIYQVVKAGAPTTVNVAATQLADLNTTISGHLDTLDKLSTSMADAWPDDNGQNFRSTLSHTISYLRELQATHVVAASSSITQVLSASHEKLSHTQATIPVPPAVPVATQEKIFNKHVAANGDAMNAGTAAESQRIAAGKAADAKAVLLAKSLANTYLSEKAKLTTPPAAPKGPAHNGSGTGSTPGGSNSTSSSQPMSNYSATPGTGGSAAGLVGGGTSGGGSYGTGSDHPATFVPVHGGTDGQGGSGWGTGTGSGGTGDGTGSQGSTSGGTLLDPNGSGGALYDANGNLIGGTGFDGSAAGFGSGGAPGGGGVDFGTGAFGTGASGVVGGGLLAAGVIAARKEAAQRAGQRAALLRQELLSEELGANGAGGAGALSASQLAAINAQRNGILAAGQQAGLMNGERTMLASQSGLLRANAAMTAQEQAQLAANQRMVPGQLGATRATATAGGARTGMPFAGGGVVGGAERVTWLVEDRDLFSADPGVRPVIET